MPDLPISSLPELTALTNNTEFAVASNGVTYKVKSANLSSGMTYSSGNTLEWEYSFGTGAQTVTSDGVIVAGFIGEAGTSAVSAIAFTESEIKPGRKIDGTRDQVWLCITPLGASATFLGAVNFTYEK